MAQGIRQVAEGLVIGDTDLMKLGQSTIQSSKYKFKKARRKRVGRLKKRIRAEMEKEDDELEPPAKKPKKSRSKPAPKESRKKQPNNKKAKKLAAEKPSKEGEPPATPPPPPSLAVEGASIPILDEDDESPPVEVIPSSEPSASSADASPAEAISSP